MKITFVLLEMSKVYLKKLLSYITWAAAKGNNSKPRTSNKSLKKSFFLKKAFRLSKNQSMPRNERNEHPHRMRLIKRFFKIKNRNPKTNCYTSSN